MKKAVSQNFIMDLKGKTMDKQRLEYRLEYKEDGFVTAQYFDTLTDVYNYITNNRIVTFMIVKEELVASRMDSYNAKSQD